MVSVIDKLKFEVVAQHLECGKLADEVGID
jgi:hypothetical protein